MVEIKHPTKGYIPYVMNGRQLKLYDTFHQYKNICVTMPRQSGATTGLSHLVYMYKDKNILCLSDRSSNVFNLYEIFTRMNVNNDSNIKFMVMNSVGIIDVINSEPWDIVIIDNYAYGSMLMATLNGIANNPNTKLVLTSTTDRNAASYHYFLNNLFVPTNTKLIEIT